MRSILRNLFGIDPRSLAVFRIAISLLLLVDLGIRAADLSVMYTDDGMFSRATICRHFSAWSWSFHFGSGDWWYQAMLFGIAAACAVALLVGYETRLATVASWLLLVSVHNRVPQILGGADNLARMLLFWGMFLPLGGVWSVDAWSASRGGTPRARTEAVLSVASAAILLQMAFVYLFSAAFKSNADWLHGKALAGILADSFYGKPVAARLTGYPNVLSVLTVGVLALEWLAPILLFSPVRTGWVRCCVVGLLASMHVGIELTMNVGLFMSASLAGLALFLPSFVWDRLRGRRGSATGDSGGVETKGRISAGPATPATVHAAQGTCAIALAYVLFANLNALPDHLLPWTPAPKLELLTVSCGLGQQWDMFADARATHGWCVARATLADGTQVDLLRQGAPVVWERPHNPAAVYPNHRWLKCFVGLAHTDARGYQVFREPVAEYLCRAWNRRQAPDKRVADFVLVYCTEKRSQYGLSLTPTTQRETLLHLDFTAQPTGNGQR